MSESIGEDRIDMTVEELSDRMFAGLTAWLLHGRGAEGMTTTELRAALKRQVPCRWLAAFCHDIDYGLSALRHFETLKNEIAGDDDDDEIWTLPEAA